MTRAFRYSRWDGTQAGFELDADDVLSGVADDLLYHGDLNAALRRALQAGMTTPDGRAVEGLRRLIERLQRRRREELTRHELSGMTADIARRLEEIVDQERAGLDRRVDEARSSDDVSRLDLAEAEAAERNRRLDELPPDLAGRFRGLSEYDFTDDGARRAF